MRVQRCLSPIYNVYRCARSQSTAILPRRERAGEEKRGFFPITEEGAKHNSPDSLDFALRGGRLKNAKRLLPDIISDGTEIKRENRKVGNGGER